MTTTPDSRIRHDWTADAPAGPKSSAWAVLASGRAEPIGTSTTDTPDTSTTAGKISVMAAYERGEAVQARHLGLAEWSVPKTRNDTGDDPCWDWSMYDYRIAPHPAPKTALQAARERAAMVPPTGGDADNSVRDLLKQIDASPTVSLDKQPLAELAKALSGLTPGRYRLVRDDQ